MYYHQGGPDIQAADGLQTLYLMNPNYSGYSSDTQPHQQQPGAANMLILNYATTGNTLNVASLASGGQQHLVGVPLHQPPGVPTGGNPKLSLHHHHHHHHQQQLLEQQHNHQVSAAAARAAGIPHFHQSLWGGGPVDQAGGEGGGTDDVVAATQMGRFHRGAAVVSPTQQGLSLSLSPQQPGYGSLPMDHSISMQQTPLGIISPSGVGGGGRSGSAGAGGGAGSSSSMSAVVSNGLPNGGVQQISHVVFGSKYLKAAQLLLDELVSVGKGIKSADDNNNNNTNADKDYNKDKSKSLSKESGETSSHETKSAVPELSTPQKQEIQMKKAKLISMLDEVEQRYRQYHHQMQIIVASFEQATGIGSARSYTQLALQTISKQFRCLKDAISSQIKAASKSLGEEFEGLGVGKMEGSRLKFVDQQLRQQRALQHLGMMQNNAWRPQRGLPERAVSVLRAWLFEHFLHPYPKDSDKQMLAKQTGLTRSQVSNWFINARVRLWKPMVEEMYSEEMKNQEEDGNNESNKETGSKKSTTQKENNNNNNAVVKMDHHQLNTVVLNSKQEKSILMQDPSAAEISNSSVTVSPTGSSPQGRAAGFGLVCALNMAEGNGEKDQHKRLRSSTTDIQTSPSSILSMDMEMKYGDTRKGYVNKFGNESRQTKENFMSLIVAGNSDNTGAHGNGFGAFTMGDLSQFNPEQLTTGTTFHGNGVSLTLGLPPSENLQPLSAGNINQHNFLSDHQNMDIGSRLEMGTVVEAAHFERVNKPQATHSSMGYETIDFENSRKRFAAAPLLPDFVA